MTARIQLGGFCALLMIAMSAIAQPDSLWSRTFGGSNTDRCYSVRQTSDGGYILGGFTESFGMGAGDFWLVKTDTNGTEEWSRTFGGSGWEGCYSVQQTSDGGYILAGVTNSFDVDSCDIWLVRVNTNGDSLWSRTYGGRYYDDCRSVQQTTDGGYILGGYTSSFGAGYYDFLLVKVNANGDSLWSRTFGGSGEDVCLSIQQTADGGYILVGETVCNGAAPGAFWMVKTDANGDSLWSRTFRGNSSDFCFSIQQTTDGGYILGGITYSYGAGSADFWLVRTDANGDSLWSRTFGGSIVDECFSVQQTIDGGYILGGHTNSYGAGNVDIWLVRVNANGDSLWSRTFGGSSNEYCYSVQQTADGGYILGGSTQSFDVGGSDFWLVKTGVDPTAADPIMNPLPAKYTLYQNYPNPFNPSTQITFDLIKTSHVSLKVFDLLGRDVATLVNDMHSAGTHHITFDGSNLPSGIYFYRLQSGDFTQTRKMVLLK